MGSVVQAIYFYSLVGSFIFGLLEIRMKFSTALKVLLSLFFCLIYYISIFRTTGVDYYNYELSYIAGYNGEIDDPVFIGIAMLGNLLGFDVWFFYLIVTIIKIYVFIKLSQLFTIPLGFLIFADLCHYFIFRDLSQIRMALSGAFIMLMFIEISKSYRYYIFGILAICTHLISLPAVLTIYFLRLRVFTFKLRLIFISIGVFVSSQLFLYISQFSRKLTIYAAWERADYGLPVTTNSLLYFVIAITLLALLAWRLNRIARFDYYLKEMIAIFIVSVIWFTSYSFISIVASRATSLFMTIYPISIFLSFKYIFSALKIKNQILLGYTNSVIFMIFVLILKWKNDPDWGVFELF